MKKFYYFVALLSVAAFLLASCKKESKNTSTGKYATGYNITQEDLDTIPKSLNTKSVVGTASAAPLPSSYFLYKFTPPVGDQGQYGTCIAWSSGYYNKTILEAVTNNYSTSQLATASNEMSAKDLFTAIPDANKSANCDGTGFAAALSVEQTRGVADLQTVPYTNLGTCAFSTLDPSWAAAASNHTISNYRALSDASVADYITDVKTSIASNTPVLIGVNCGNGFQAWTGSGVMTTGFNPCGGGGECGGHAQTIVGFNDAIGTEGAFRVINSWNTTWGDNGFYWVDYNFMFTTLAQQDNNGNYAIFVATNGTGPGTDTTAPPNQLSGIDLASWVQEDDNVATQQDPTERQVIFNVYNIGTATAPASANWGLYYVYYNAFDANDYGVIIYDQMTNSVPTDSVDCSGNNCTANVDIPAGTDLATDLFGATAIFQTYTMPTNITGDYYLILIADAGQVLNDVNYANNIFYTAPYYVPFVNGYFKTATQTGMWPDFNNPDAPTRQMLRGNQFNTAISKSHPNAYTPKEILGFLKQKKASGELDAKVRALNHSGSGMTHK